MNRNSTIGIVLILAIFVGYIWWITPSKEEQVRMIAERDSIMAAYQDSVATAEALKAEMKKADSLAEAGDSTAIVALQQRKRESMGVFNTCAVGDSVTVTVPCPFRLILPNESTLSTLVSDEAKQTGA